MVKGQTLLMEEMRTNHEKKYNVAKILYLYAKYGSLNAVRMRMNIAPSTIKEILIENNIEIKKPPVAIWNLKGRLNGL